MEQKKGFVPLQEREIGLVFWKIHGDVVDFFN
jgi:hypothetical protein